MHLYIYTSIPLYVQMTTTNLLMNYIALVPGVPTRMHFSDHYKMERVVLDKDTGKEKPINSLVFWVDTLEGEDTFKTFSILSKKLSAHFEPFLKGKEYLKYDFIITEMGKGYYKDWNVQTLLRPPE